MKFTSLAAIAAAMAVSAGTAVAADLPSTKAPAAAPVASPWDYDIGAGLTSDYMFRGITQSAHGPSVAAHGELRYNANDTWQLYIGTSGESINFNADSSSLRAAGGNTLLGFSWGNPSMEWDGDAGVRGTFGKFSVDVGGIVYGYPNTPATYWPRTYTWEEGYIKPSYNVTDSLTIGANFSATPSYANSGAPLNIWKATSSGRCPTIFRLSRFPAPSAVSSSAARPTRSSIRAALALPTWASRPANIRAMTPGTSVWATLGSSPLSIFVIGAPTCRGPRRLSSGAPAVTICRRTARRTARASATSASSPPCRST